MCLLIIKISFERVWWLCLVEYASPPPLLILHLSLEFVKTEFREAGEAEELAAVSWILRFLILLFCGPDEVVWVKLLALIFEVMEYLIIMRKFLIKTIIVTWRFKQTL